MTSHELSLVRQVLSDAYWTKLTIEEAVALNSLFAAVANAPETRSAEEERADVVAYLREYAQDLGASLDERNILLYVCGELAQREHVGFSRRGVS